MNADKCLIWSDSPAERTPVHDGDSHELLYWRVESSRSGGAYNILGEDLVLPVRSPLADAERARLTTVLVDWRHHSGDRPDVTGELIERARRAQPLDVHQRAERLLRLIGKESLAIGDSVSLMNENARMADIDSRAMAWSESTTLSEVRFLVEYLLNQGWIQRQDNLLTDLVGDVCYTVTVDGYRRLGDIKTNADATQAFVAMWFDEGSLLQNCRDSRITEGERRLDKQGQAVSP